MISPLYRKQVELLLTVLPHVAKEPVFALKGGTAINLFECNMPRLSVDIDLVYLPFDDRTNALKAIADSLQSICNNIEKSGLKAQSLQQQNQQETRIVVTSAKAKIKVEVNTVTRGHIFPERIMNVSEKVEKTFQKFVSMKVISRQELYGGKICAALDRQHPRDMFDVHSLFQDYELSDGIRLGSLCMMLCHPRPLHELLHPHFLDQKTVFERQFSGMTDTGFSYEQYEATRKKLLTDIHEQLTENEKNLLLSFKTGAPDWSLVALEKLPEMPAIQWKLLNIQRLKKRNPKKHAEQVKKLEKALNLKNS